MTAPIKSLAAALTLILSSTMCSSAHADIRGHIDRTALEIDWQARQVVNDCRAFRHTPEYPHLISDARRLSQLAYHMHEVVQRRGSLALLESDLQQLDYQFRHLDDVFRRVHWRISSGHGGLVVHADAVRRLLNAIQANIHYLQDDVRRLRSRHVVYPAVRPAWDSGYWGSGFRGRRVRGRTISFGGGSSRLSISF